MLPTIHLHICTHLPTVHLHICTHLPTVHLHICTHLPTVHLHICTHLPTHHPTLPPLLSSPILSPPHSQPADADKLLFTPGPDIVSILLHGMAADARAMAVHKNANYTIQKALEVASEAELLDLATPLLQDLYGVYKGGYRLPQGKKLINTATFVLRAAVLRMVRVFFWGGGM